MSRFSPVSPDLLVRRLAAELLARQQGSRPLRVGLDAPACANVGTLVSALTAELRAVGRQTAVIEARDFLRDASLRLEYGKTDVDSFYSGWLDTSALQREVLTSLVETGRYLPSLRDPVTNRSSRAEPVTLAAGGIALITGELLLGTGLSFDVAVHAAVSRQARRRLTRDSLQWTLPAFDRYDVDVDPAAIADLVFRYDDPGHPALLVRTPQAR